MTEETLQRIEKNQFSVNIWWSEQDGHFLAMVPEMPGVLADGATHETAVRAALQMAQEWVEAYREKSGVEPPAFHISESRLKSLIESGQRHIAANIKRLAEED